MHNKTKLELTWIGKDQRPRLEPRILLEDPALSYHASHRVADTDLFDSRVIFGDNLLALKALEKEFTGKIKCVCIDPPYNTGSAFTHYDDGVEHSLWLSLMRERLEILRVLLAKNGSLWVNCDDNEAQYLKVMMDEVMGRDNFVTAFIWQKVDSPNDNKVPITPDHEYILCYSREPGGAHFKQKEDLSILMAYRSRDEDGLLYRDRLLKKNGKNSLREDRPSMFFPIADPDGNDVYPIHDDGREACWASGQTTVNKLIAADKLVWKLRGIGEQEKWVPYTREYAPENPKRPWPTIWTDAQTTRQAKAHLREVLQSVPEFPTPKPEPLVARVLSIATDEGDWVLDSFAGSGTTGTAAHKMNRRFIMIELGDHVHTHILPRLHKVVDGTDQGGISQAAGWQGGGGFRYYKLAPSLLQQDSWGQWVINKAYNPAMMAEAVCKHEGFTYAPSDTEYWNHGHSSEQDFLYVTTQTLTHEQLAHLSEEVGDDRTLLVCCAAFRGSADAFPNLTIRKIPNTIASRCEWGRDDYNLQIASLPPAPENAPPPPPANGVKRPRNGSGGLNLFDETTMDETNPAAADAETGGAA